MSSDRGMDKEDVVHIYSGILDIKNNEIMPFAATWMDLDMIILGEVSQTGERQMSYDITYMWALKKGTDGLYKTEIESQM